MSDGPAPSLNRQIKDFLLSHILSGQWPEGYRIPTEMQLCEQFGASRMTVNRAVRELAEMGYLSRSQGSGTFVAKVALSTTMLEIRSIRQDIEARGGHHAARVLKVERHVADEALATALGVAPATPMAWLEALHLDGARPIQLERRWVNLALVPGFLDQDFAALTASEYLLASVPYSEAVHEIDAIGADPVVAGHLGLKVGTPCLRLVRRTLRGDDLVTQAELIHPGAEFRLTGRIPMPSLVPPG